MDSVSANFVLGEGRWKFKGWLWISGEKTCCFITGEIASATPVRRCAGGGVSDRSGQDVFGLAAHQSPPKASFAKPRKGSCLMQEGQREEEITSNGWWIHDALYVFSAPAMIGLAHSGALDNPFGSTIFRASTWSRSCGLGGLPSCGSASWELS